MNEPKKMSSQIWSWIGKAAVLLGLILGAIQLYSYLKTSDYSISAIGDYSYFIFPDSLGSELTNLRNFNQIEYIEKLLQNIKDDRNRKSVTLSIKNHFAKEFPSILNQEFRFIESVYFFEIKNDGKKEIKDLYLEVPFDGFYRMYPQQEKGLQQWLWTTIFKKKQEGVFSDFSRTIKIASLRPSNIISIIVWTNIPPSALDTKDTKVTFPEGVSTIKYPEKVEGVWGQLYYLNKTSGGFIYFCSMIMGVGLLLVGFRMGIFFANRKRDTVDKSLTEEMEKTTPNKTHFLPESSPKD